jgi:hypothetical protein
MPTGKAPETASSNDIGMIHVQRDDRRAPLRRLAPDLRAAFDPLEVLAPLLDSRIEE